MAQTPGILFGEVGEALEIEQHQHDPSPAEGASVVIMLASAESNWTLGHIEDNVSLTGMDYNLAALKGGQWDNNVGQTGVLRISVSRRLVVFKNYKTGVCKGLNNALSELVDSKD